MRWMASAMRAGVRLGLDDAGAGDEEERAAAERDVAEGEAGGVGHRVIIRELGS